MIEGCDSRPPRPTVVYIAAPLFNEMERTRNAQVASALEAEGFVVYLPQRDAGVSYDAFQRGEDKKAVRTSIFSKDVQAVADCDILVCLLDGRVPDEGTCIELGMAF